MNFSFIKRILLFKNINGAGDIRKELNYFNYLGINDEDMIEMLSLLKENENNMNKFKEKIYNKILFLIEYYSTHYVDENGKFVKEFDEAKIQSIRAYLSSSIYLAARLITQEYWYIRNVIKTSFTSTITIPTFGKNKYNYSDYLDSIPFFYRELLYFHMCAFDESLPESFDFYSQQDNFYEQNRYNLPMYKNLFMLIWIHTYARIANSIFEYGLSFDSENPRRPFFRPNLLKPLDIAIVKEDEDITEDVRKRRDKDLRIRESYEIKAKIEKAYNETVNQLKLYNGVDYNIAEFIVVMNCMADILEFQSTYEYDDFITILKNKVDSVYKKRPIPKEIISMFVNILTFKKSDLAVESELHILVRHLLPLEKNGKKYIHCEYETAYFTNTIITKYSFWDDEKIKEYYNIYFPLINTIAVKETIAATRRFKLKWLSLRKHYFWLEKKKNYAKFFNLVDDIIYFPETKMLIFLYWCNVLPQPRTWGLYSEDFQLMVGKDSIVRKIINDKVVTIEMHFNELKKIFKMNEGFTTKTVILFDGTTSLEQRQVVEDRIVNLCPIKCIADFFVNDVYKR